MKRIQKRSCAALLLSLLLLLGNGVLLFRLWRQGGKWAAYNANLALYNQEGVFLYGTLTDRNGIFLASSDMGELHYADKQSIRMASLHAVGDLRGYTEGAYKMYGHKLAGYSPLYGTTHAKGNELALSLDANLQKTAWNSLGGCKGCILVSNYKTGEILVMVSAPTYDPLSEPDKSIDGLFLNRALQGVYAPGSVFKTITLCAALENIPDLSQRTFLCTGSKELSDGTITCSLAHGEQSIAEALANSCNCTFGTLALELGGENLESYARRLGFTSPHSLDGASTASGSVEISESADSFLAWSGIGQHKDMINPYAMLRYLSAIAGGGEFREPTLLLGARNKSTKLIDPSTASALDELMHYTFTTHYASAFPNLDLCAKTGTAELGDGTNHAWFVGYCHSGAPLCFVVCLERGGTGFSNAGSVANAVLQEAMGRYGE